MIETVVNSNCKCLLPHRWGILIEMIKQWKDAQSKNDLLIYQCFSPITIISLCRPTKVVVPGFFAHAKGCDQVKLTCE